MSPTLRRAATSCLTLAAMALGARSARAAPPWVARHLTLPGGDWAFNLGLGVDRARDEVGFEETAAGVNAEMAVGLTSRVELGVRTGIRPGNPFDRSLRADEFGRLFDRQTFGTGTDVIANPEIRVRGAPVRTRVVELALEGRIVLPFEPATDAGVLFGMPLAFHLGTHVRLDTGVYLPVVFHRPEAAITFSAPLDLWIQASPRLWLGPMMGVVAPVKGSPMTGLAASPLAPPVDMRVLVSLGFGLGYAITHYLDLKTMVLFPAVNRTDPLVFGLGAGVEIRIE